jgi:hypothetical protein
VGTASRWVFAREAQRVVPAGFLVGLLHGAAMPCTLPALVWGTDLPIYATLHQGRPYKLGYTAGVNACGALVFGLFYRRRKTPPPGEPIST